MHTTITNNTETTERVDVTKNEISIGSHSFPLHTFEPESIEYKSSPAWFEGGWLTDPSIYKRLLKKVAQTTCTKIHALDAPFGMAGGSLSFPHYQKARAVASVMEQCATEKSQDIPFMVAHSQGCIVAMHLVRMLSCAGKKVHKLVMLNPAGMIGPDTLSHLTVRFVQDLVSEYANRIKHLINDEQYQELNKHAWGQFFRSFLSRPLHSLALARAIANTDMAPSLRDLQERCGTEVSIFFAEGDVKFPPEDVKKKAQEAGIPSERTVCISGDSCHGDPAFRPDGYIKHIETALCG